jgi:hypothetical protein
MVSAVTGPGRALVEEPVSAAPLAELTDIDPDKDPEQLPIAK